MMVCVVAIDQQLSDNMSEAEIRMAVLGNVLRDNMSRDCSSKKTSAFEMAEEDSAESCCVDAANVELDALNTRSVQVTDELRM